MAGKEHALGATGREVMGNVKRARGEMTYAELSRRLADVGRPIPPLGLRRIEAGDRRVDVDDLMALALVLNVSPLSLLLPHGRQSEEGDLAGNRVSNAQLWKWAVGEKPLGEVTVLRFQADSLPSWFKVKSSTSKAEGKVERSQFTMSGLKMPWNPKAQSDGDH
ncbi:helix-turn-helix domain-containing protein [Arthrobacter sp. Leaf234]|uniref:helix-turn-helix domain-containing protein n=1 Tax=Arthrobacter sp. Leaf234 TaxID=1736303 RepID=UPI0019104C3A|nr:helix-turn-helix transcriptional regulator [Arthrobacter sp. Leaf234]